MKQADTIELSDHVWKKVRDIADKEEKTVDEIVEYILDDWFHQLNWFHRKEQTNDNTSKETINE